MRQLLFLWLVWVPIEAIGFQSTPIKLITSDDGLSQNLVFDVMQDSRGFIWIGTKDGLNRYDGSNFRVFRNNPSDVSTLPSNYITRIREDKDQNLWIETRPGGINFYDQNLDHFIRISETARIPDSFLDSPILDVYGGKETGWWFSSTKGFFYLSPDKSTVSAVSLPGAAIPPSTRSFVPGESGDFFYFASIFEGIYRFNKKTAEIESLDILNRHLTEEGISYFMRSPTGYWIVIQGNVFTIIGETGELHYQKSFQGTHEAVNYAILYAEEDHDGNLWFSQSGRFYRLHIQTGSVDSPVFTPFAISLLVDRSGVFWLGTSGHGLYKYDPKSERFGQSSAGFFDYFVPGFFEEIASKFGINPGIASARIFNIRDGEDGYYWVLTSRMGLFSYHPGTRDMIHYPIPIPPDGHTDNNAFWMEGNPGGGFDILYSTGIVHVNPAEGVKSLIPLSTFFPDFRSPFNLPVVETLTQMLYAGGYYWVGSVENGLGAFNPQTGRRVTFKYERDNPGSISSNHILSISADPTEPEKYVWVGTDGGGLNRIDIASGEILRITENEGLPNNVIYAIYPDGNGFLWMSSNSGLIRLNPVDFGIKHFTREDGLQSNEFNRIQHTRLSDGRIAFCGTFGCNVFNPDLVELNPAVPQIALTEITVLGNSVLPFGSGWFSETNGIQTLHLDWKENMLRIEFAAMEFSSPTKNRYKYRFPPFVPDWTETGTRREVTFTNLDPGQYRFEVMGSNNDGIWSSSPAVLYVHVRPPFWMTTWFRFLVILMGTGLVSGVVWYFSQRKYRERLRQIEYKVAVDQERLRISRDMHDDLGSRLTQIRMMSQLESHKQEQNPEISKRFSEISKEAEDVIQNFSEIVWSLNPQNDPLDNLCDYMVYFSENFCRKVEIPFRVKADEEFPGLPITSDVRHNMLSVLKEALNNAAKYARCTEIHLRLTQNKGMFKMEIVDNGIGFSPGKIRNVGQGLANMHKRIESIGGKLELSSAQGVGTKILVTWPLPAHPFE